VSGLKLFLHFKRGNKGCARRPDGPLIFWRAIRVESSTFQLPVLDEADRMFDMSFELQVMKILACVRLDRQTVMFSATISTNIQSLAVQALGTPA
jgi:superfamily II DNA/RNA helicase